MFLFSLSLSLLSLLNHNQKFFLNSSFYFITYRNLIQYQYCSIRFIIQFISILITRFNLYHMIHTENTIIFDTSVIHSNLYLYEKENFNQNANDIDKELNKENRFIHRLTQSSTDIKTKDLSSLVNRENSQKNNGAIRIESALMTSDYSHLLNCSVKHVSQSITDFNKTRTIDLIKRNGAGDENLSSYPYDKQMPILPIPDNNQYLTLEQVPIRNRRTIRFSSKQLILISVSVFLFVIVLSLTTIFLTI